MDDTKKVTTTGKRRPPNAGKGRPKGVPNKENKAIREMILEALHGVGGVQYLQARALDPKTAGHFLSLLGRVLPTQVTGEGGGAVLVAHEVKLVPLTA